MKKLLFTFLCGTIIFIALTSEDGCDGRPINTTAKDEQAHTEINQQRLLSVQALPDITWSLERDNLIKRFKLQNDRTVSFFMYIFIEGVSEPIGFYQVNKVSSVNSQLSNTEQIVYAGSNGQYCTLPSPAEDGSYGTNGDGIFGFTPEDIYIETDMHYITSTVPLSFQKPVNRLAIINTDEAKVLLEASKKAMNK